ncbi:MAG TPA: hypothetical protein VMP03_06955 [Methylomirabilota bacterium]|nr:hypothetical protein [Methylomirabilota bacterium]
MSPQPDRSSARFRFAGAIDTAAFAAFAADRVRRLDLRGLPMVDGDAVVCDVWGWPDLVDAFEMACLIGPAGSLVTEFERTDSIQARRG